MKDFALGFKLEDLAISFDLFVRGVVDDLFDFSKKGPAVEVETSAFEQSLVSFEKSSTGFTGPGKVAFDFEDSSSLI